MKKPYIYPTTKVYRIYPKNSYGMDTLSQEVAPDYAKRSTWSDLEPTPEEEDSLWNNDWQENK